MKLNIKRDFGKSGIYIIKNRINNKVYVGKSINIYIRIKQHITLLNTRSLDENRYLISAWHKYGKENFEYSVLEYLEPDDDILKERELFWMRKLNSTNRDTGYNLREDTTTNCIVSQETRELQSRNRKARYAANPHMIEKIRENSRLMWKNNPEKMQLAIEKVSRKITKHKFYQYDKNMTLIKEWETVLDILKANPTYKRHNIYAVCSGEKPSMYGYVWKKELIEDMVQSSEKFENLEIEIIDDNKI
jgi:group I intron endonuclease